MKRIELLAPAGNFEALKAAVEAGANAVYLAGNHFGARAYAGNFTNAELEAAVTFAHMRDVKVHVTVNTIVNDDEMGTLAEYLKFLYKINVDAILVQDLGVAALAMQVVPALPLHASTQMTVHSLEGVKALEQLGFERVVLARELSLEEIRNICANSSAEIEVFMHGALCVCYSGQCLMSSMIGARSGNRGQCAQPCRLPYELSRAEGTGQREESLDPWPLTLGPNNPLTLGPKAGKYLLSPKDLNTIDLLPKLIEAGVSSLKIEGRMKRPEYVAIVVETYRKAIDRYYFEYEKYKSTEEERRNLAQIFNRDFTTAYLEKPQGKKMISYMKPNNRGLLIGRVAAIDKDTITIKTNERINAGDQLEIWVKVGGRVTITVSDFNINGDTCTVKVDKINGIKVHDRVFKVFDAELTAHARHFFNSAAPIRKLFITVEVIAKLGEPFTLGMAIDDGRYDFVEVVSDFIVEPAKNQPLDIRTLSKQIGRLGDTIFELGMLNAYIDNNVMVPLSVINDVRRRAIKQLEDKKLASIKLRRKSNRGQRAEGYLGQRAEGRGQSNSTLDPCPLTLGPNNPLTLDPNRGQRAEGTGQSYSTCNSLCPWPLSLDPKLTVNVDTIDMLNVAISAGADAVLFGGESYHHEVITPKAYRQAINIAHDAGRKIYIATPRIVRNDEQSALEDILSTVDDADGVYVHNIATLNLARRLTDLPIHTDYSLITFNSQTIKYLKYLGIEGVTLSPELTFEQIKSLVKSSVLPVECIVHGRAELMISSYCVAGSFLGGVGEHTCSQPCKRQSFFLRDRKAAIFPVVTDQFCRMHILNSKPLSMLPYAADFKKTGVSAIRIDGRAMTNEELENIIKDYHRALQGEQLSESEDFDFTRGHYFRGVSKMEQ